MDEKHKKYSYLFTLSIVVLPILNSYEFPIRRIGFGEFILIIIMIFGVKGVWGKLVNNKKTWSLDNSSFKEIMKVHWPYAVFLIYSVLITAIAYFFTPSYSLIEVFGRLSRQMLYGFVLLVYTPLYFKPYKAFQFYKVTIFFAVLYLSAQVILNKFGYSFYPNFIASDLLYTIQNSTEYRYHLNLLIVENFRPTSFFLEPSYYVEYAVPFIAVGLFIEKKKKSQWLILLFVAFTVFITKSANGIVFLGVVLMIFFIYQLYTIKLKNKYLYTVFFLLILANIFAVLYYMDNNYVMSLLSRFNEVGIGKGNTSGNIRILRGFLIFVALGGVFKVIGIGFGNYLPFKADYKLVTEMDHYVDYTDYMSGFTQILTSGGLIGIVLFLFSIHNYTKYSGIKGVVLASLLMVMMLSSSFYATPVYLLIMSFIISFAIENRSLLRLEGE